MIAVKLERGRSDESRVIRLRKKTSVSADTIKDWKSPQFQVRYALQFIGEIENEMNSYITNDTESNYWLTSEFNNDIDEKII